MIVRIMGEGQLSLDDSAVGELNKLDTVLEAAIEQGDEAAFGIALGAILTRARELGTALPLDTIEPSDLILPRDGATIDEVRELLGNSGLIPG
ncbi:MAG: PspA-associated protein PspAA [Streptosporangiaceae bacterium]